ncbi:hypothetical protein [Geoglobus ahangari]
MKTKSVVTLVLTVAVIVLGGAFIYDMLTERFHEIKAYEGTVVKIRYYDNIAFVYFRNNHSGIEMAPLPLSYIDRVRVGEAYRLLVDVERNTLGQVFSVEVIELKGGC